MSTKLTLTIEAETINKAKRYAKKRGRSLSDLVENYLKALTEDTLPDQKELTLTIKNLKGSFKAPSHFNYKKELARSLSKKYAR